MPNIFGHVPNVQLIWKTYKASRIVIWSDDTDDGTISPPSTRFPPPSCRESYNRRFRFLTRPFRPFVTFSTSLSSRKKVARENTRTETAIYYATRTYTDTWCVTFLTPKQLVSRTYTPLPIANRPHLLLLSPAGFFIPTYTLMSV